MQPTHLIWSVVALIFVMFVLCVFYRDYRLWRKALAAEIHASIGTTHAVFRNPSTLPRYTRPNVRHGYRL